MASNVGISEFFRLVVAESGSIPRRGLLYLGLASAVSAVVPLTPWAQGPSYSTIDAVALGAVVIGWMLTMYTVSMLMFGARLSLLSLCKFIATSWAMAAPFVVTAGVILAGMGGPRGLIAVGFAIGLAALVVVALLPGWPITQAASAKLVGPLTALRSTRGFRWPLILASLGVSALAKAAPEVAPSVDLPSAYLAAIISGVVTMFSTMFGLAVAVTASRLMLSNQEAKAL